MSKRSLTRLSGSLILILFSSLLLLSIVGNQAVAAETTLAAIFPNNRSRYTEGLGNTFLVDITISNIFNLYGYGLRIYYNTSVLTALNMTPYQGTTNEPGFFFPTYRIWKWEMNSDPYGNGTGYVWLSLTLPLGTQEGKIGSGKLATFEFNATGFGTSALFFETHDLGDPQSVPIPHTLVEGEVTVGELARLPVADAGGGIEGRYRSAVNVSLTLDGSGSYDPQGVTLVSWDWDFGDGTNGTGETVEHTYRAVGNFTVWLTVMDVENLTSPADDALAQITVDTTPPTGSVRIAGGAAYTNTTSVTLGISYFDAESGVSQMRLSNDNDTWAAWEAKTTSKSWTLLTGDGTKTVFVQFNDKAGWTSLVYSDSILLDTAPPTATIVTPSDGSVIRSSNINAEWTTSDSEGGSGIDRSEVRLDAGSWTSAGASTLFPLTDLSEYGHRIDLRVFDKAGNSYSISSAFTVNFSPIGGPGYIEEAAVGAVAIVAVAGVGVYFFRYRKKS